MIVCTRLPSREHRAAAHICPCPPAYLKRCDLRKHICVSPSGPPDHLFQGGSTGSNPIGSAPPNSRPAVISLVWARRSRTAERPASVTAVHRSSPAQSCAPRGARGAGGADVRSGRVRANSPARWWAARQTRRTALVDLARRSGAPYRSPRPGRDSPNPDAAAAPDASCRSRGVAAP